MATQLIFIRHGATTWNKEKRYCGFKDVALSKKGMLQAARLCRRIKDFSFDRVYCSDRKRALQTAEIIFKGIKIIRVKNLREMNFGVLEGLRHQEVMRKYPAIYRKWLKDPVNYCIPRAENLNSFKKRISSAIKKIVTCNRGKTVAIVCHGGTIGVFITGILKRKNFWRYIPKSASISIVELRGNKPELKLFNEVPRAKA